MYKKFFGFTELPFQLVPNPAYLYLSKSHEEALAHLTYAISQGDGFVEITGEVGTGKTTLCRVFLDSLSDNSEAAYIFNPKLDSLQLLKAINDDFNLDSSKNNIKDLIDVLNEFLLAKKKEQKTILLIIDEAQNLASEVLEQLRLLSNLETSTSKLLQIILVGQPELSEKFETHELRQLGQRITLSCHILPLTFEETCEYIRHRIHIASGRPVVKFDQSALKAIYRYSKGVPRLINILSDRALLTGYVLESRVISGKMVKLAIAELKGNKKDNRKNLYTVPAIVVLFVVLLAVFAYGLFSSDYFQNINKNKNDTIVKVFPVPENKKEQEIVETVKPLSEEKKSPQQVVETERLSMIEVLTDSFSETSRSIALQTALKLWNDNAVLKEESDLIEDDLTYFKLGTKQNGMVLYKTEEEFSFLMKFNLPAILEFSIPGYLKSIYMVCIDIEDNDVILTADNGRTISMRQDQLDTYWTGIAYIPWKNFLGLMGTIPQNAPAESVLSLKMLMRDLGFSEIEINSNYDNDTKSVVMKIQEKYDIEVDGTVGALTKIAIYNEAYSDVIPHIVNDSNIPPNNQEEKMAMGPVVSLSSEDPSVDLNDDLVNETMTKVTSVGQTVKDDFVEINISGENINSNFNIFSIPPKAGGVARIVCDIKCSQGVRTKGEKVVPVNADGVDKIRYFTYQGKMRVVVDISEEKIRLLSYKSTESEIKISVASDQQEQIMKIADGEIEILEEGHGLQENGEDIITENGSFM